MLGESDLGSCVRVFSDSTDLPRWLQDQDSYNVGRRALLWMLKSGTELQRAVKAESLTLIALRHAQLSRGEFGGIQYAVNLAQRYGANVREIVIQPDGTVTAPQPRTKPAPQDIASAPSDQPQPLSSGFVEQLLEVDADLNRDSDAASVPVPPPAGQGASRSRRPGGNGTR